MSARLHRSTRAAAGALVVLVAGAVLGLAGPAAASADDPTQGGLWYYTVPGIDQIHASGITGQGIRVAVIDTTINPDVPDLVGTSPVIRADSFCDEDDDGNPEPATSSSAYAEHGTSMVTMLLGTGAGVNGQPGTRGVAPGATVLHYADSATDGHCPSDGTSAIALALDQAVADGTQIVSMSLSTSRLQAEDVEALAGALRAGVVLVVASNNRGGTELGPLASANGVIVVESADVDQQLNPAAVTNPLITVVAPGEAIRAIDASTGWTGYRMANGSSSATAWTAGVLALAWSAHPEATGNQMIQALLRTTAQAPAGEPTRIDDSWGYGTVSARKLVAMDPTTLPDTNPLLRDTPDAVPAYAEIVAPPATAEPTDEPTDEPSAPPVAGDDTDTTGGVSPLLLAGGIGLVLLAAAGITIAVVLSRRTTPQPTTTHTHRGA